MIFSLVFIFVLSVIVTLGSYLILKSELEFTERFCSVFFIFLLFSSITILNEYKQPIDLNEILNMSSNQSNTPEDIIFKNSLVLEILHAEEIKALEKRFYVPYHNIVKNHYKLPIIRDSKAFLAEVLDLSDEKIKQKQTFFYWVNTPKDIGISFAFREFSRSLQGEMSDFPILYLDLKGLHDFFLSDLEYIVKASKPEIVDKVIENFNKKGAIPIIIVDAIDYTFKNNEKNLNFSEVLSICQDQSEILSNNYKDYRKNDVLDNNCYNNEKLDFEIYGTGLKRTVENSPLFNRLINLFNKFELKIIVINYDRKLNYGLENHLLPHFIEKKKVRNVDRDWENYILTVINEYISDREKRINEEKFKKLRETLDLDFRVIAEYYHNFKNFKSIEGKHFS